MYTHVSCSFDHLHCRMMPLFRGGQTYFKKDPSQQCKKNLSSSNINKNSPHTDSETPRLKLKKSGRKV